MKLFYSVVLLYLLFLSLQLTAAKQVLSPQLVVDRLLQKSLEVQEIQLRAQEAENALIIARGRYDTLVSAETKLQSNRAENLSGTASDESRQLLLKSGLSKRSRTGTVLALSYEKIAEDRARNSLLASQAHASQTQNVLQLSLTQELLNNSFGVADRLTLMEQQQKVTVARLSREEELEELILRALRLFWDTYAAEENFTETLAAREKYQQLVATVQRKAKVGYAKEDELARAQAELEIQEQNVKIASASFLQLLDQLLVLIDLKAGGDIDFSLPVLLPPLPPVSVCSIDSLRRIKIARLEVENRELQRTANQSQTRPRLDFVASAATTGVEDTNQKSLAEMAGFGRPTYAAGLVFQTIMFSSATTGERAENLRQLLLARNRLQQEQNSAGLEEQHAYRQVAATHFIAHSTLKTVALRETIVRAQEKSYRQGRLEISDLIKSYNELFQSRLQKIRHIGNYHIALDTLAACRDQLIKEIRH